MKAVSASGIPKSMKVGKVKYITGKYSPLKATGVKVTFKSSKKKIVSVDQRGRMKALKAGKAVITVKAGGKSKKYKITVKK